MSEKIQPFCGQEWTDGKTGIKYWLGPEHLGGHSIVRDWSADDTAASARWSGHKHPSERVAIGCENIACNHAKIKSSPGIIDLELKDSDTVFLIGSGSSLRYHLDWLPEISRRGTTIATNRAIGAFKNVAELLDYGWVSDPEAWKAVGDFWTYGEFGGTKLVANFAADARVMDAAGEVFFHGDCVGTVPEWEDGLACYGIDKARYGVLDSGWCALFSQLHLLYKLSKEYEFNKIVLLGHDFALVDNWRYFDQPVKVDEAFQKTVSDPGHSLLFSCDINGVLVATQNYLFRQSELIKVACRQFATRGIKVINATNGGILFGQGIEQGDLDDLL